MTRGLPERERLNRASARDLARGRPISAGDFERLRSSLTSFVRAKVTLRSDADYGDAVDAALERFMSAAQSRPIHPATALAYLRRIAANAAIDEARKARRLTNELPHDMPDSDDAIARFVDERASADIVEVVLAECVADGDRSATRVINAFLNLAEELGSTPSTRLVAERAQVSHTTVQHALKRLRGRISGTELP